MVGGKQAAPGPSQSPVASTRCLTSDMGAHSLEQGSINEQQTAHCPHLQLANYPNNIANKTAYYSCLLLLRLPSRRIASSSLVEYGTDKQTDSSRLIIP